MPETVVPTAETPRPIEHRDSRETVVKAFNTAFSRLEQKPEDQLTATTKWTKEKAEWVKKSIKAAKEKTIDQNKSTFTNEFVDRNTGEIISQEEGVPIEDLLEFLGKEIDSLPPDSEDRRELVNAAHILVRPQNSQRFTEAPHRMETTRLFGRVSQEASFIAVDSRATGDDVKNWVDAETALNKRIELVLPPEDAVPAVLPAAPDVVAAVTGTASPTLEDIALSPAPAAGGAPEAAPPAGENPAPQPQTLEQIRREFTIVNRTVDIRKRAAELAEDQLRNEMRRGRWWNPLNWPRKIGLRVAGEFYRQRFIERATHEMRANNNSYLTMDVVQNAAVQANHRIAEERAAGKAKIEQVKTGEVVAGQQVEEAQGALKDMMMSEIIKPLIDGQITNEGQVQDRLRTFVQDHEADPQVQAVFGHDATQYGRLAEYFATDLLETAQAVKQDIQAHRYAIDQLNEVIDIRLANTSWAAETQANFNVADRAIAWAQSRRLTGWLINPATVGAGMSLATFGLMRIAGTSASVAAQVAVPGVGTLFGAGLAAVRRNYDLKVDMASHRAERAYSMQIPQGAPRREALERFAYNTASIGELINGGGQEITTGTDRKSMKDLLSQDLSGGQVANREAIIRRITEIKSRLDFSAREHADLVTFEGREQVEQGRLQLIKTVVEARQALRNAGMTDAQITPLEARLTGEWNQRFTQNREQQDRAFLCYRMRNAAGAGVFGAVSGLVGGLVSQEAIALGERALGMGAGQTVIEKGLEYVGLHVGTGGGFNHEMAKNLFQHPGNVVLNSDVTASVAVDHTVNFLDAAGNKILTPPVHLTPDGNFVTSGDIDNLPDKVKSLLGGWEHNVNTSPDVNIQEKIKALAGNDQHETFTHGNTIIDINSGPNGQMSMQSGDIQVHGFLKPDGSLDIDRSFNGNASLTSDQLNALQGTLKTDGWGIAQTHVDGGSVIDHILNVTPDQLKQQGIIETDQFPKQWNFHVLRPDIVSATGMHTHNELTLHVGMLGRNGNLGEEYIWGKPGTAGLLNFGGEIHGGEIQSHLFGVPPKIDAALNDLMQRSGGLKLDNMMMVVDLTDDRQIMLPMDASGNAHLPDGLYDTATGALRGIKSIASAVIQGPDGKILSAQSILDSGQIPGGSVVHSLASEKFPGIEIPPVPPTDIFHLTPPAAIDYLAPEAAEAPPIIPIPFAPRHPLEPLGFEVEGITYYEGLFPKGARMNDMLRRGRSGVTIDGLVKDPAEGAAALREASDAFRTSDEIYVVLGGAIGDAVISTAYVKAIEESLRVAGKNTPITVIVNQDHGNLYDGLASANVTIKTAPRGQGAQTMQALLAASSQQHPIIFDFEHFLNEGPTIEKTTQGAKNITTLNNLFPAAIEMYNNDTDPQRRYASFMEELLSLPASSIDANKAKPTVTLPANADAMYDALASKTGIDKANPNQIAIVVEASVPGKRYSMDKWAALIEKMKTEYPGYQFNVIFNSAASPASGAYAKTDIESSLSAHGVLGDCHIIDGGDASVVGELMDLAALFKHQKLVLGNDTGLGHIAGALEQGPSVITVFMPGRFPPAFWVSSQKQTAVVATTNGPADSGAEHERDEAKKGINNTQTEDIMEKVRPVL